MVTLLKNNFTGQTVGPATTANSGASGAPFSHLVASGGTTFAYANVSGNIALDVTPGTGQGYPRWTTTGTDGRRAILRRSFTISTAPTAIWPLLDIRTEATETAALASIHVRSGFLQIQARAGNSTDLVDSRFTLPSAGTYWIELAVNVSSAAAIEDAVIEYRVYADDETTLLHSWTSGETLSTSHSLPNIARFSGNTSTTGISPDRMDGLQALFTDDLAAWLGPYGETRVLPTPVLTITEQTKPTKPGEPDGYVKVSWPKIIDPDVNHYEVAAAPGHNALTGFVVKQIIFQADSGSTCVGMAWGLEAGTHTISVRAMP